MTKELSPILKHYIPIADLLVQTFGEDCEVVLHDLSTPQQSVVYVANNHVTGRKVGDMFVANNNVNFRPSKCQFLGQSKSHGQINL